MFANQNKRGRRDTRVLLGDATRRSVLGWWQRAIECSVATRNRANSTRYRARGEWKGERKRGERGCRRQSARHLGFLSGRSFLRQS